MLLIVIFAISSYYFFKQVIRDREIDEEYENIKDIVTTEITDNSEDDKEKLEVIDLKELYEINNDLVGWIKIDGTNISYPVMQNGDYYLRRNIYKDYSYYGTPYLAQNCDIKNSDNLIIYGHHIKNNSMFGELENYKKESFYKEHKYIKFYTLENEITVEHNYEIISVFQSRVYYKYETNVFRYYYFVNAETEDEYNNFVNNAKSASLYDTGKTATFGDQLITLSTCAYHTEDGRFVVVGRLKN